MKSLITLLATAALASSAFAGPAYSGKNAKAPVAPAPAPGCECFGPGFSFDVFGGAFFPESGGDDVLGGGVGASYFFNRYVGLDVNYGVYASDSEHHQFDGNLVLRAPIDSLCIAPYALVGGGFSTNGSTDGSYNVGGGLDIRLQSASCLGIFAEGLYHFGDENPDFTTVRLGLRIPF